MSRFAAAVLLQCCTAAALEAPLRALRAGLIDRTTATALMRSATVRFDADGWARDAARSLRDEGFCVVRAGGAQISDRVLERCRTVASARLCDLLARVGRRGVELWRRDDSGLAADGVGVDAAAGAEPFRYLELVHREGTGRYDMPLPWCVDGQAGDVSLPVADEAAFGELHAAMDDVARPVVSELWPVSAEMRAGCVISEPGALAQPSHRDGPDGLVTVFAPLTAFVPRNGPTELSPATHRGGDDSSSLAPLLQPGDVLLFDYRCLHRGLANQGDFRREVAYAVYSRQGVRDIQNFPSATTLEYD
ncbi:unnamed protein product [Pelagomonas calceolata]|uniref:Phytanoyl-CoA dioxygenase n=2 Tax=Pelagomonas calceolata TaxID=35677 RepID=A0A8J2SC16_9STRA|nr:unnamed protein product [Pelagomonas calceolata]